jgi:predicted Rossmann fold nucleotide-binding protein DprA/Smf involved in DNA uptake
MLFSLNIIGNKQIINQYKIAFLCSQKCPANIVLKSYDWAITQREKGNCVISGFHSKIEKDIFHFLLQGKQSIILLLARGLKNKYQPDINKALEENRLLIISSFKQSIKRITKDTSNQRNRKMIEMADEIFIAYASPKGKIIQLVKFAISSGKKIYSFDLPENEHLFKMGVIKYN